MQGPADVGFTRIMRHHHDRHHAGVSAFLLMHAGDGNVIPAEDPGDPGEDPRFVDDLEPHVVAAFDRIHPPQPPDALVRVAGPELPDTAQGDVARDIRDIRQDRAGRRLLAGYAAV